MSPPVASEKPKEPEESEEEFFLRMFAMMCKHLVDAKPKRTPEGIMRLLTLLHKDYKNVYGKLGLTKNQEELYTQHYATFNAKLPSLGYKQLPLAYKGYGYNEPQ